MSTFEVGKTYNGYSDNFKIPVTVKVNFIGKNSNPDPLINEVYYLIVETIPLDLLNEREVLFIDVDEDGVESVCFISKNDKFLISAKS